MFESDAYAMLFERIAAVRAHREDFLVSVRSGSVSLEEIFDRGGNDPVIGALKVLPAVESLPSSGKVQTRRAFGEVHIAEDGHVSHVAPAQLAMLPAALERHAR